MERLGEADEFGGLIAGLLELAGWRLHPPRPMLGGGYLFVASRFADGEVYEVKRAGGRWVDVASLLLEDAFRMLPAPAPGSRQLTLPRLVAA